jgi:colanic acid/amylovoran biosynthesis glycosyltransferase
MGFDPAEKPCALQRCDQFVGRTTNWLYDHLREVPRYTVGIFTDELLNRIEFPELMARSVDPAKILRRAWLRLSPAGIYPPDARALRKWAPVLLHSHFGYVAVNDLALQEFLGVPWLVSFYGADVHQLGRLPEWRTRCIPLFDRAWRVLALGPYMAEQLEKLGCRKEKILIHALGVDVKALPLQPRKLRPHERLRLMFAGIFREKKGIRYLIEAAGLARESGVQFELHLVGDAGGKPGDRETKADVFERIRRFELGNLVIHHSFLKFTDLIELALRSHIFVAPSVTTEDGDAEGTPFVLQQMMATGMPVIATVHSDIPFVLGKLSHLLVPEKDCGAIAERIKFYAQNPKALGEDGLALREQISENFDVRACAARLSNIYDEVQKERSDE